MKIERNFRLPFRLTLVIISVLIISACTPAVAVDEPVILNRTSPTPALTSTPISPEIPITGPSLQPTSEPPSLQARLAVITSRARLIRGENAQDIQRAQAADIQVRDQLEIVRLDGQSEQSHSILQFPDLMNVELLGNTNLSIVDARPGEESPAEITLDLMDGHIFVHLSEEEIIHLTVRTPHATINAFTAGTDFDVCHTEELTCVMVKRGVVEIVAKDGREIVKAGSASVVLNDEAPAPAICAPIPRFITWEQRYRLSVAASSLQQEIAALPQQACPVGANGFPLNARILYEDEFSRTSQGWDQGQFGPFTAGYVRYDGGRYYQVQAQGPDELYLSFVPKKSDYEDVNIDIKTRTESASEGDFRYGVVLRRLGDQYYAFAVSPVTKAWYFLKSSPNELQILKEGVAERMRGLEGQDTLRVEAYGSTFLLFVNNRFIDWISDPDYARGEVGFFVDSMENPDALINFNSITIWDIPAPAFIPVTGERCFNVGDDDGDGLVNQADPDCQRPDQVITFPTIPPLPTSTLGIVRTPTSPLPTSTLSIAKTPTSQPTSTRITRTPRPTNTRRPTQTPPPQPTSTRRPTRTPTPEPTDPPQPTRTPQPTIPPQPTPEPTDPPPPTAEPTDPPPPTSEPTDPPPPTEEPTDPPPPTEEPTDPPPPTSEPTDPPTEVVSYLFLRCFKTQNSRLSETFRSALGKTPSLCKSFQTSLELRS